MKEFNATTGGRYTYADDLENLQDLALAFAQIFDDCDNFIVSGCKVTSSNISAGYVFINGKLRYFPGATGVTWPQYIYESNTTESVTYESGGSKVGRNIYGCAMAPTVPTALDMLTGKVPASLPITATGGKTLKDAFFGKYALLLNPEASTQTVNSIVNFANALNINGVVTAKNSVVVQSGAYKTTLSYYGGNFNIVSTGGSKTFQLSIIDGVGLRFYSNGTLIATIGSDSITFAKPVSADKGTFGGLILTGDAIYQGTSNAIASLNINMVGYNGDITQARNTYIGNGQGVAVIGIVGSTKAVTISGATTIQAGQMDGLLLKATVAKTSNSLTNAISWVDSAGASMARIGFLSADNQEFSINVASYNINVVGTSFVNIGPAIKENGILLSEKYALSATMTTELSKKADSTNVYSKTDSDSRYGAKSGGLSQFISATHTQAACRNQIGALGSSDLADYVKKSQYLADMATDENAKKKIRDNIGAASSGDYEKAVTKIPWTLVSGQNELYVKQIGNIVCVQGKVKPQHSGTVFTLPNTISAPTYAVGAAICFSNNRSWRVKIAAGQRSCTVAYCDSSCGNAATEFSLTYMV